MTTSEELAHVIEKMLDEKLDEKMKVIEDTYFAKARQTLFTKAELADEWGCSTGTAGRILREYGVRPIGKQGKSHVFDIESAKEAKAYHDGKELSNHELNWKMRAM